MGTKQLVTLAALLCCAVPSLAFDGMPRVPSALFYVEIPLDAKARKDDVPNFGFAVQGRQYRAINIDTRVMNALEAAGMGVEAKWVAGAAAALLLLANGGGSKGGTTQQASSQPPGGGVTVPEIPGGGGTTPPDGGGGGGGGGGTPSPCCGTTCTC